MKSAIATLVLLGGAMLGDAARAEGTMVWNSIGYRSPQGSDSRLLNPDSRDAPSRAEQSWAAGPYSVGADAYAGFGSVTLDAAARSAASGATGWFVNAGFADELTLSRPDLAGQAGQLTLSFYYDNRFSASAGTGGSAYTYANWFLHADDAFARVYETHEDGAGSATQYKDVYVTDAQGVRQFEVDFDERYMTLAINFVWGQPVLFGMSVSTSGDINEQGSLDAELSAYWGGIVQATAGGAVIGDYALTSRTGTDYSRAFVPAVPEPGPFALFAAGVLALAWRLRGRRSRFGVPARLA